MDVSRNHNYAPGSSNSIFSLRFRHGTAVSGLIAARDENGLGVRGVAPRATIYGYNYLALQTSGNLVDAMTRNMGVTAVSNNSWGPNTSFRLSTRSWEMAVKTGVNEGFNGKGTVYVWAGGNEAEVGDNSNYDSFANYYAVVSVCAVNSRGVRSHYSEVGANLWICAPSSGSSGDSPNITTTDNSNIFEGLYSTGFGGTSAATPMVSGVVALVRQANPELSWRDVKLVLAGSARKNDASDAGWEDGAVKYRSVSKYYAFNHSYGFGVVDAQAAVDLAQDWDNVPPMKTANSNSVSINQSIPDNSSAITSFLQIDSDIDFVEFVEINVDFSHKEVGELDMRLISPSSAVSRLILPAPKIIGFYNIWRFGSAKHLGEDPNGIWKLSVADVVADTGASRLGEISSWELNIYGHSLSTPAVSAVYTDVLTEENLDGSTLILRLTGAIWSTSLSVADFDLVDAPTGISLADATRNTDRTVTLTLAFDGTDFDIDYDLIVQMSATAIAVYVGEPIISSNHVAITANQEASGEPSIIGIPQVGIPLTATMGSIADGNGLNSANYAWQWQVLNNKNTWTDISNADTADFIPALIHQGQFLRVMASFTDNDGFRESRTSTSVGAVLAPPPLIIFVPARLTEENLDGATLILTLTEAVWNDPLLVADFSLSGAPAGVSIMGVERNTDTTATLTLVFDGTDFDSDIMIGVTVLETAYSGANSLGGRPLPITANQEASGEPSIIGIPQVDIPLTATMGSITDGNGINSANYEWQWQVSDDGNTWTDIPGANTAGFILALIHQDQFLRVVASFADNDGFRESRTSISVGPVLAPPRLLISIPMVLTEANLNGSTLILTLAEAVWSSPLSAADFSLNNTPPGARPRVSIAGVTRDSDTTATLTLAFDGTDFDNDMTIGVTVLEPAHSVTIDLVSRLITITANQEASGAPSITDTPRVDIPLTATMGSITDGNGINSANHEWQWQASNNMNTWTDIPNADTANFIPALIHQDQFLRVVASFTDDDGFRESRTSISVGPVLAPPRLLISVPMVLTETNLNGSMLILTLAGAVWNNPLSVAGFSLADVPSGLSIADVTRDSNAIATLTLAFDGTDFDSDMAIGVTVLAAAHNGAADLVSRLITITANQETSGEPSIMGNPQVGIPLTATIGSITDGNGINSANHEWQWQASDDEITWTDIPGANKADFIPALTHQDQFLRVVASFTDNAGFRESRTSISVGPVLAPPPLIIFVSARLTEENLDGTTFILTLTEAVWNDPLSAVDFSLHNAPAGLSIADIVRNTSIISTLTLAFDGTDFDSDMAIGVTVSATAHSGTADLVSRLIPITANQDASGEPSITGIPQVGIPLTATMGSIADGNGLNTANYAWQWQISTDRHTWTDIPGANTAGFIPALTHQDQFLRVVANFTDDDGFRENRASIVVDAVLGLPILFITAPVPFNVINLNDSKLILNLTEAVWSSSLSAVDFSLNSAPAGVSIARVERNTDTTATLTLAFDGTDFDIDYDLIIQISAAAIAVYVGEPIINSNQLTVVVNREASGAPSIMGTTQVGIPLTATTGSIADGNGLNSAIYEWQWQISNDGNIWTDIPGANTADFVYTLSYQYQFSRVVASFTDDHGYSESRSSTPANIVLAPPRLLISAPTVLTGENLNGATLILTLTDAVWSSPLSAADFSLADAPQFVRIDRIERSSDITVTLTLAFAGAGFRFNFDLVIQVLATAVSVYIGEPIFSVNYVTVIGNHSASGAPSIMGNPQVGTPLTATIGSIADGNGLNAANYEWQWQVSNDGNTWTDIPNADTADFIPALIHQDQSLRVMASFTDNDGFRESRTSISVGPVLAPPPLIIFVSARLTEENLDGTTFILTLTEAVWNDPLSAVDFSLHNAPAGLSIADIVRNTDTTATLTLAFDGTDFDSDMAIGVTVSATAHSGTTDLVSRLITITANQEASGEPSIIGTLRVGFRLTATMGSIADGNGINSANYAWQWQISNNMNTWTDIPNADTADFIPALMHQDQFLRVVASFTDDDGFRESRTSISVGPVLAPSPLLIFVPTALTEANLNGSTLILTLTEAVWSSPLSAVDFSLNSASAGLSITDIVRNTDTTAMLTLAFDGTDFDSDMAIGVTVLATAHSGTIDLEGRPITITANHEASGEPSIMDTPRVGFRLMATIGSITDGNGLHFTNYEWQWQVTDGGNMWTDILNADTANFIPALTHQDQFLRVVASFTDDDGFRESHVSAPTSSVLKPPFLIVIDRVTEIYLSDPGRLTLVIRANVVWANPLSAADFRLHNAPTGLSIAGVDRDSDTVAFLNLEFDGTDFDNDFYTVVEVSAAAVETYVGASLTDQILVFANQEASGAPSIMGTPQVGIPLTATMGSITDGNGLYSVNYAWQWQVSDDGNTWTDIPGANTADFIPALTHQDQFLRVVASFTDSDDFRESRTSISVGPVLGQLISVPTALTEANLNGSTLILTLTEAVWNDPLLVAAFSLNSAPPGVSIADVTRDSDTTATLTLAFDGTDFDSDMAISVTVLATAHSGTTDLVSRLVTITANQEASGEPSIIGTLRVGVTLTATIGGITDGNGLNTANYAWQWQVSDDGNTWTDIPGANTEDLMPLPGHQGQFLRVVASFTDDDGFRESRTSISAGPVLGQLLISVPTALTEANLNGSTLILTLTEAVWSTPLAVADFSLSAAPAGVSIMDVERNTDTTATLTLAFDGTDFDSDMAISVTVSATAHSGTTDLVSRLITITANQEASGAPSITGTPQVGILLTATIGGITDGNGLNTANYAWQWQISTDKNTWTDIPGANTAGFMPALIHQDQFLRVMAGFTDDDGFRESRTSTSVATVLGPPSVLVTVSATLTEINLDGSTLVMTITDAVWNASLLVADFSLSGAPAGVSIMGVERNTDTAATLTLAFDGTDFDSDMAIGVTVLATAHSGTADLVSRLITITANQEASGAPSIMGTPKVDILLTATTGSITDGNGLNTANYAWQWQVSDDGNTWTDIPGVNTADFIPALMHQDQFLRVVASFTDNAGFRESRTSISAGPVLGQLLISVPTALTEANLNGSTLILTLTEAVWSTPLAVC